MDPPDPRRRNQAISSDLKVVLETALQKDPNRRYQSAAAFAEDLRRVRQREPILARRIGQWTRLLRWAQRSPALAITGGSALVILITGFIVSSVFAVKSKNEALRAESHLKAYNRLADALVLEDLLREVAGLEPG